MMTKLGDRPMMLVMAAFAAMAFVAFGAIPELHASRAPGYEQFHIDEESEPDEPEVFPDAVEMEVISITRGKGPQRSGWFGSVSSSVDDTGVIDIALTPESQDHGLVFEIVDGLLPDKFEESFPREAVTPSQAGVVSFIWSDGATDEQEEFDFVITATWVDRWGRQGPTSEPLRISHPGSEPGCGGCATGASKSPLQDAVMWLAGLAVLVVRRRARRRGPGC